MSQPCFPADAVEPDSRARPFELDELCHEALHAWRDAARRRNLTVSIHLEDGFRVVHAHRERLGEALELLVGAALAVTPRGGRLVLEAAADDGAGQMHFVLVARGAAGDMVAPGTPSRFVLSRAQRLVDVDAGLVTQERGARFELRLALRVPIADPGAPAFRVPSQVAPGGRAAAGPHREILLAEDDDANIAVTREYLDARGFDVHVARDGREVVSLARCLRPALILMDVQMPGTDGLTAMRALRADPSERVRGIPIIALTALTMPGDRERCMDAGADAYLAKPAALREVAAAIEDLLEARIAADEG